MEKNWFILMIFTLAFLVIIIFIIKKNYKDRKGLFRKLPGDYPDPKNVDSEFDFKD
jgi:hypothetical protein